MQDTYGKIAFAPEALDRPVLGTDAMGDFLETSVKAEWRNGSMFLPAFSFSGVFFAKYMACLLHTRPIPLSGTDEGWRADSEFLRA